MWHGEVEELCRSGEKPLSFQFIRMGAKQTAETIGESVY